MESNKIAIAALLFIVLIVGSNFVIYVIARSWAKSGDSRWMSAIRNSLSKPMESSSNKAMEELRKQIAELENKKDKAE
jgi:predicted neutral ceramidase superfamily lipid hydrolase